MCPICGGGKKSRDRLRKEGEKTDRQKYTEHNAILHTYIFPIILKKHSQVAIHTLGMESILHKIIMSAW